MSRDDVTSDEETGTESTEEEVEESEEESVPVDSKKKKEVQVYGFPDFSFSYERLPKKCLKFSFLCVNGASFLAGISASIISIWMLADGKLTSRLVGQRLFMTILLCVGFAASAVSFLGIVAIVKKNRNFILVYILCHVAFLCSIFVCAVMSFSFFDQIMRKVRGDMTATILNYHSLDWVTEAWDNTQSYLRCCGIKSYNDWYTYNMDIPKSCCALSIDKCLQMNKDLAYKNGCLKGALVLVKSHVHSVAVASLFVAVTLAVSLFLAIGVRKRLLRDRGVNISV